MKTASFGKLPWDMVVFLTITTVGLGVSFKRLAYPEKVGAVSSMESSDSAETVSPLSDHGTLDLGCLDRRSALDRITFKGLALRVKGQLCDVPRRQIASVGGIRVRNLTSKEEGTVFLQGSHTKFVSNQFSLLKGKNVIQVEWTDPKTGRDLSKTTELYEP